MIKNLSGIDLSDIDYNLQDIDTYEQVEKAKILIISEDNYDEIQLRLLYVSNPKLIVILICKQIKLQYYEVGVDIFIDDIDTAKKVNLAIRNLDVRHKLISKVVIKEDFNKINIGGIDVRLTPKEMEIYSYFNAHRGELCRRSEMLTTILGYHEGADSRVVDVYVKHLRSKLREEGYKIETIRGKGYIYNY